MKVIKYELKNEGEVLIIYPGVSEDFLDHLKDYENSLVSNYKLEAVNLDYSIESLKIIDNLLNKISKKDEWICDSLLYSILAYFGETMRRKNQGIWKMDTIEDEIDLGGRKRFFPEIHTKYGEIEFYGEVIRNIENTPKSQLFDIANSSGFKLKVVAFHNPLPGYPPLS